MLYCEGKMFYYRLFYTLIIDHNMILIVILYHL